MAHGGTTVGANLEVQTQQILIGIVVSAYILIVEGIVHGLGKSGIIDFGLASDLTNAFALALFCFVVATIYTYTPRLSQALKINTTSAYMAFTRFRMTRHYNVQPLPGFVFAQLIGAAVSTAVNIFVFPSTASYNLMGSYRELLVTMSECCEYFADSVAELGIEGRKGSDIAVQRRIHVRKAAEKFGRVVGGSRYETTIERFSQVDYHYIFLDASRLSSSFSTMCLPFEIDDTFYYQLEDPMAQIKHGSMTTVNHSMVSVKSFTSERPGSRSVERSRRNAGIHEQTVAEVAEMHRCQERRKEGVRQAIEPIRAQLGLHRKILHILLDRTQVMECRSPTKSLLELVARLLKKVYKYRANDAGLSGFGAVDDFDLEQDYSTVLPFTEGDRQDLHEQLEVMSLDQMADVVDQHIEIFEQTETECIKLIAPFGLRDNIQTHEKHVVFLSFMGALRENAICLATMLRTVHRINAKRPDYVQFWFPKLSWSWLYRGRIDDEDDNEADPVNDNWSLENAYGTTTNGEIIDEPDGDGSSNESTESGSMLAMNISNMYSELGEETSQESSPEESGSTPRPTRRHNTEVGALYQMIDNPYARAARGLLDWIKRPKTRYAFKFTVTMMVWAIWAYIGVSRDFFIVNNGVWGLTCTGAVFGVTIGSTFNAGFNRVLGALLSGAWGIVAWRSGNYGQHPYLPCFCCIIYFVVSFYVGFFVPKWASIAPVMVISFSSVLFSAVYNGDAEQGTSIGWKHVMVNAVAILFTFIVSSLFMPYRARTALRIRLAELLRLNTLVVQGVNHMHMARSEFPTVHRNELKRVRESVFQSRIIIAKCRQLIPSAVREPSVHEKFQLDAHLRLINTLETQLEWLLYSFFTHSTRSSDVLSRMIRLALGMREDIIGSKAVFNSILASALSGRKRLPAYLPDIGTARRQFIREMHPLLVDQYTRSFDITYLSRWNVGIWHLIATQTELCAAVRTIVGAETDRWPEEVGFMLDCLEQAPQEHASMEAKHDAQSVRGQWFSRLPKYTRRHLL
ncbi:hypothetical protein GGH12_002031 [Coemansia sp. RSA 1822]|nr:hypothetical protein LPJ76_005759 [Coemansia sp. RSA 638]KAJ2544276.1 hypothetical protein GGF49_001384 [Coemansia sp. RSA 1853]KAJ2564381.1 hypothetical protein GGH12_002031 [Coemansia sp. RSA 1822]